MLKRTLSKISARLSGSSKSTITIISFLFLFLITWLDYLTSDYSLIIFYLIPVSLMAWFVGTGGGVIFCLFSMAARILTDYESNVILARYSRLHYWNLSIELFFLLAMSVLFSALKKNIDTEKQHGSTDHLTGAMNRRAFFELAEYLISRSHRYGSHLALVYMDLDNFKLVNDRGGHAVGDSLLKTVVSVIRANLRKTDLLARFGGDEFVILLPDIDSAATLPLLEKLQSHLQKTMDENNWPVTFSIGAITYEQAPPDIDAIINGADGLMYKAKHAGKNRILHETCTAIVPDTEEVRRGQRRL